MSKPADHSRRSSGRRYLGDAIGPIIGAALAYGAGHWWCELFTQIEYHHEHRGIASHIDAKFAENMVIESFISVLESMTILVCGIVAFILCAKRGRFRWVPLLIGEALSCLVRWGTWFVTQRYGVTVPDVMDAGIAVGCAVVLFLAAISLERPPGFQS